MGDGFSAVTIRPDPPGLASKTQRPSRVTSASFSLFWADMLVRDPRPPSHRAEPGVTTGARPTFSFPRPSRPAGPEPGGWGPRVRSEKGPPRCFPPAARCSEGTFPPRERALRSSRSERRVFCRPHGLFSQTQASGIWFRGTPQRTAVRFLARHRPPLSPPPPQAAPSARDGEVLTAETATPARRGINYRLRSPVCIPTAPSPWLVRLEEAECRH